MQVLTTSYQKQAEQSKHMDMIDLATPTAQVSAFIRAVIGNVWPRDLFGSGEGGAQNWKRLMVKVDAFVQARRYETLSLDSVMDGVHVSIALYKQDLED